MALDAATTALLDFELGQMVQVLAEGPPLALGLLGHLLAVARERRELERAKENRERLCEVGVAGDRLAAVMCPPSRTGFRPPRARRRRTDRWGHFEHRDLRARRRRDERLHGVGTDRLVLREELCERDLHVRFERAGGEMEYPKILDISLDSMVESMNRVVRATEHHRREHLLAVDIAGEAPGFRTSDQITWR